VQQSLAKLARVVNRVALTIAAVIAIVMPLGYWVESYQSQATELNIEAQVYATLITQLINSNPEMWRFEEARLTGLLERNLTNTGPAEQRRILDAQGNTVAQHQQVLATPLLTRSAELFDSGMIVGRVEISRSLLPLVKNAGLVGALALALALAVFVALRVLPMRALTRTLDMLRQKEERLRAVLDNAMDGIITTDPQGRVESLNPAAARIFGYAPTEAIGRSIETFISDSDCHLRIGHSEAAGKRKNDTLFPIELSVSEASVGDGRRFVCIVRDITERKEAEKRTAYLANYDGLTGLPNRNLFLDRLNQAIIRAQRNRRLVALLFLDIDRFKKINDSLGHSAGDNLLQQVANRLQHTLRKSDTISRQSLTAVHHVEIEDNTVSRLGGDEFTLILENLANADNVTTVAQKILDAFVEPFQLGGHGIYITTSIGITIYPTDSADLHTLIKNADTAMYRAKEQGRNNYQFYTEDMNAKAYQRLSLETSLRRALERNEFLLHYQPKLDLRSGQIMGVEALLRWQPPDRAMVSPAEFIPLLEDTGLIIPVGRWVLHTACAQLKAWQDAGLPQLSMAVNLSARQFRQKELAESIGTILLETRLDPHSLELELTESLLMENLEANIATMTKLEAMGVRISIDDFGTGYSSLSYLKRFPIHTLKIDRSFVRDITTDPDDAAIANAVIALAHSLRLNVVAEGVETQEQLDYLQNQGCEQIQGYLLSRPLPAESFEQWIKARSGTTSS
jgi:PAS domain S-box-containing protein